MNVTASGASGSPELIDPEPQAPTIHCRPVAGGVVLVSAALLGEQTQLGALTFDGARWQFIPNPDQIPLPSIGGLAALTK